MAQLLSSSEFASTVGISASSSIVATAAKVNIERFYAVDALFFPSLAAPLIWELFMSTHLSSLASSSSNYSCRMDYIPSVFL